MSKVRYKKAAGNGWENSNLDNSVSRIGNQAASKVGPNSLLKVMAGDVVSATTQYYYQNHSVTTESSSSTMLEDVLTSLLGAMNGGNMSRYIDGKGGVIKTQLAATPAFSTQTTHDDITASTTPKSWLSVLFFDERFNFVSENSTQIRATVANSNDVNLTLSGIKAPKNGYAYIYVSNSSDEPVYFDNFKVAHTRGRIVEEDHYYAYGLKIAGISSTKLADATGNEGHLQNRDLYNDKELFDEGDLNWYDYGFRNYDPQIGRFVQIDPLTDEYKMLSGYSYASNDPITNIDVDGLFSANPLLQMTQCAGVVLSPAVSVTRMAAMVGVNVANIFLQNAQNDLKTQQAGQVNQRSLDGQRGLSAPQALKARPLPVYVNGPTRISYFTDPARIKNAGARAKDKLNDILRERKIQAEIRKEKLEEAKVVVGMLMFAVPEAFALGELAPVETQVAIPKYLYQYTSSESAESILQTGLTITEKRTFIYATDVGNLSPLQAQIELALPAGRPLPNAIIRIDVSRLKPLMVRRVTGNLNGLGAGGGREFLFNQNIPASLIERIR